jgi:hypothetical protein
VFLSPNFRQPPSSSSSPSPMTPHSVSSQSTRATSPITPRLNRNISNISIQSIPSVSSLPQDEIETAEEAAERESRDSRLGADRRAAIALGEKLQLKLKVSISPPPLYLLMTTRVNFLIPRILLRHFTTQKLLIEFLYLSKCLLIKSRRLLFDTAPQAPVQTYTDSTFNLETIYGERAPASPSIQSQRHNTSGNLLNSNSFGGTSSTGSNPVSGTASVGSSVTGVSMTSAAPQTKTVLPTSNALLESNTVWQKEMEKGYDNLLEAILPFLGSMAANSRLQR